MKRIYILFALAFAFLGSTVSVYADDKTENKPVLYEPIVVRNDIPNFHRSLGAPIFADYIAGIISLDFVENLGAITVVVQNLTTGGQVVELIDTGMGNVVIDIDSILTVGDYYMSITTMSGEVYYAEFTLE